MNKWKYFIDTSGNKSSCAIVNGSQIKKSLTDVYFELSISNGNLLIDIEEDFIPFYRKKRYKLYNKVYELCVKLSKSKTYDFYSEISFKNCRIVNGPSASIKNKYPFLL